MASAFKELDEVTECSICTGVFADPRVLPCVHTYCLKCILSWAKDKKPRNKLACPLCRKECAIPENGYEGLPTNFFVEKMLRIRELTRVGLNPNPCDMCKFRVSTEKTQINSATSYCLQCRENYCKLCANAHSQQKLSRDHILLPIGEEVKLEDLLAQYPPANCDKHVDEVLKIYCNDCRFVICMMCYIKDHNGHKCSDVSEVTGEFRTQMTRDVNNVADGAEWCKQMLRTLTEQKKHLGDRVRENQRKIRARTDQLKQIIDRHEESLLNELESVDQKRINEINSAYSEVERQQRLMETYTKYACEIREKGTACDIARAASGLHDRADELLMIGDTKRMLHELGHTDVTFKSSDSACDDFVATIGKIHLKRLNFGDVQSSRPSVVRVLSGDAGVHAVAFIGDELYVARNNQKAVQVYDVENLTLKRSLPVPQLSRHASAIAACPVNRCLYLSDVNNPSLHRVDLSTDAANKWFVGKSPKGLSLTNDHNVLVACMTENKLQEYTTEGRLVREICLQSDTKFPWHAVQLSTGQYVVIHYTSPGVVSVIRTDGQVVRSYGTSSSSDVGPMKLPRLAAVTKDGDVLVTDQYHNRIVAINSSFTRAQRLPLPSGIKLCSPRALQLDESRHRLYVGELTGDNRVFVFAMGDGICWQ